MGVEPNAVVDLPLLRVNGIEDFVVDSSIKRALNACTRRH
jgi:hypothetical protein